MKTNSISPHNKTYILIHIWHCLLFLSLSPITHQKHEQNNNYSSNFCVTGDRMHTTTIYNSFVQGSQAVQTTFNCHRNIITVPVHFHPGPRSAACYLCIPKVLSGGASSADCSSFCNCSRTALFKGKIFGLHNISANPPLRKQEQTLQLDQLMHETNVLLRVDKSTFWQDLGDL